MATLDTTVTAVLKTTAGDIKLQFYPDTAPRHVENFLTLAEKGFYDGTIFHRVIPTFMVQGGGYDESYEKKPVNEPVENEADNGLKNVRGSVAMARTSDPHSATAQFFVNVVDNDFLDHTGKTDRGWGYAVFGEVVDGMDVVDTIKDVPTGSGGPFAKDAPQEIVRIVSITRA